MGVTAAEQQQAKQEADAPLSEADKILQKALEHAERPTKERGLIYDTDNPVETLQRILSRIVDDGGPGPMLGAAVKKVELVEAEYAKHPKILRKGGIGDERLTAEKAEFLNGVWSLIATRKPDLAKKILAEVDKAAKDLWELQIYESYTREDGERTSETIAERIQDHEYGKKAYSIDEYIADLKESLLLHIDITKLPPDEATKYPAFFSRISMSKDEMNKFLAELEAVNPEVRRIAEELLSVAVAIPYTLSQADYAAQKLNALTAQVDDMKKPDTEGAKVAASEGLPSNVRFLATDGAPQRPTEDIANAETTASTKAVRGNN